MNGIGIVEMSYHNTSFMSKGHGPPITVPSGKRLHSELENHHL